MRALWILGAVTLTLTTAVLVTGSSEPSPRGLPSRALGTAGGQLVVPASTLQQKAHVVLVTLDGARWQDVLAQPGALSSSPAMPKLLELVARNGVALRATTSSKVPLSLPGYQALAAGRMTSCEDNDCARLEGETVAEGLARGLGLPMEQVAVFASWARLSFAAAGAEGAVTLDAPPRGLPGPGGPPWEDARWDVETTARALSHLTTHRPRFLQLALLDTDEWAHQRDAQRTVQALRAADDAIAALLEVVRTWPEDERRLTTLLVTTDHGRGPGSLWHAHGAFDASRNIFLLAAGDLVRGGDELATQADVRPTIERLFGLCPRGSGGRAVTAIVGDLPCGVAGAATP
ncbi:MAG: hypothetical protein JNJ54_20840 [Myxococcaceae bacterium]|nr:hypothetical protein [Myxococcaceae bacterium]